MKKKADADRLILEIDAALEADVLSNSAWLDVVDEKITQLAVLQLTLQHLSFILLNSTATPSADTKPAPPPPPADRKIIEGEEPQKPKS